MNRAFVTTRLTVVVMENKSDAGIDRQAFAVEVWRSESDARRTSIRTRDWGRRCFRRFK